MTPAARRGSLHAAGNRPETRVDWRSPGMPRRIAGARKRIAAVNMRLEDGSQSGAG
jgi:hypothetical protein